MATGRTSVTSLPPILDFGRYQILGRLAVGGMAEIYLAREPLPTGGERHVVLKRVLPHAADDPRFAEMFLDEARVAMRLSHPGICHVYEFGEQGGTYYLAMEWVNGVSLGKLVRRAREHGGIPTAIAAKIIAQVADALHYAHGLEGDDGSPLNIVHRDVSPGNIMIAYGGSVRLLDFGIAKAELSHARTSEGQVKGKFAYMSPQHCRGEHLDGRADVFSLGVCLYEAVTGRPLYHRKNEYDIMRAVIEEPVPSIRSVNPELPEGLDAIVKRALAKQPEQRWDNAAEVQEALERWLAGSGQVVHTGRIKEYLAQLFEEDIANGPSVDSTPFGKSFHSFAGARPHGVPGVPELSDVDSQTFEVTVEGVMPVAPRRRRRKAPWLVAGALVLLIGAGGLAYRFGLLPSLAGESTAASAGAVPVAAPAAMRAPAPAITTPAAHLGSVEFSSRPPGASVELDGRRLPGQTPLAMGEVEAGEHSWRMARLGSAAVEGTVVVVASEPAHIDAVFASQPRVVAAPAEPGRISINTRPWSKVYLGARLLGTTPIGRVNVPAGNVRLRLVDRDGNVHRENVRVEPGGEARVFYDLREQAAP